VLNLCVVVYVDSGGAGILGAQYVSSQLLVCCCFTVWQ